MEAKRLILAVVICAALVFGYQMLSYKMGWIKSAPAPVAQTNSGGADSDRAGSSGTNATAPVAAPAAPSTADLSTPPPAEAPSPTDPGKTITVDTPLYRAVFQVQGGVLREFLTKKHLENTLPGSPLVNMVSEQAARFSPLGLLLNGAPTWGEDSSWDVDADFLELDAGSTGSVRFTTTVGGVRLTREMTFTGDNYTIDEKTLMAAPGSQTVKVGYTFSAATLPSEVNPSVFAWLRYWVLGGERPREETSAYNLTRVAMVEDGSLEQIRASKDLQAGKAFTGTRISWMGVMNNYFLGAVSTAGESTIGRAKLQDGIYRVVLEKTDIALMAGQTAQAEVTYFVGPKETAKLDAAPNLLSKSIYFGWFSFIAKPLLVALKFFYSFLGNYGLAIILLTLAIKIIFLPLSYKSFKSMQQMKKIQPLVEDLKQKYGDDKEKLQRETMNLYKTYKINPMGGCLPLLVQMPVFFGLYQALLNAIELRHAVFIKFLPFTDKLWLADLSAKDPFFITPIIMGLSMFLQQKMTPAAGDPTQAKMMMFMPLIFTVIFLNFPAGLVVYWLVNNILSIAQQWHQLRGTKEIGKA